jgi:hypothetical protein
VVRYCLPLLSGWPHHARLNYSSRKTRH